MAKCKVQWIDAEGNPTPDDNEAVASVSMVSSHEVNGSDRSEWFPICAAHLKMVRRSAGGRFEWAGFFNYGPDDRRVLHASWWEVSENPRRRIK